MIQRTPRTIAAALFTGALLASASPASADERYLVQVKDGHSPKGLADNVHAKPRHVYTSAVNGFAAELNDGQLNALRHNPNVVHVVRDELVSADATTQATGTSPWGLDRIDQRSRPLSQTYTFTQQASTVRAYVLDTGIATAHADFEGRAINMVNKTGGSASDCNGHGTHVAGTIGSKTFGVAKKVLLRGVKVLSGDCQRSGWMGDIIAGVDWVRENGVKPAVVNMSLGGGWNPLIDMAVDNLSNAGFFVAVAAGNDNVDACNVSPAAANGAFTVAASDKTDVKASFSNKGPCVEMYAPGVGIKSTWLGGNTATLDGTSMASPHVAGVAALFKGQSGDQSSAMVRSFLINNATTGAISSNPSATPNRLLFKPSSL
jgi:subtilisin family serine protease